MAALNSSPGAKDIKWFRSFMNSKQQQQRTACRCIVGKEFKMQPETCFLQEALEWMAVSFGNHRAREQSCLWGKVVTLEP